MKIGLFPPFANPLCTPEHVATVGRAADERGFSSLWVAEHVVLFEEYASRYPYLESGRFPAAPDRGLTEPFATIGFLAAVTTNIRLGTGVLLVPQRNPVYTAKSVTTLDWLSNGRMDLGIGVGWLAEEFAALGVPFGRRGERCDEYLAVMRSLWTEEVSSFKGEFYELPAARQFPKPVQLPHPPIHVGGESNAALRRAARLAEGWYGYNLDPAGCCRAGREAAHADRRRGSCPRRRHGQRVALHARGDRARGRCVRGSGRRSARAVRADPLHRRGRVGARSPRRLHPRLGVTAISPAWSCRLPSWLSSTA